MTTIVTPAPVLVASIDTPPAEPVTADAERAPWFRGWAVAGAILAMIDVALVALAVVIV